MSNQPVFQKDVDAYLRLYRKFLEYQYDEMSIILNDLPTDVIERVFGATTIHKNEDKMYVDFGFNHIEKIAAELKVYSDLHNEGKLENYLSTLGHKVNSKKIGVRK